MSKSSKLTVLENLTATYTDSDDNGDSSPSAEFRKVNVKNSNSKQVSVKKSVNRSRLVSYSYIAEDTDEEKEDDEEISPSFIKETDQQLQNENEIELEVSRDSIKDFESALIKNGCEDPILPPEPPGCCSSALQEKIARLYEMKLRDGCDMNAAIQKRKNFRNPTIYESLISFCQIDELGTNYPKQIYDPHIWEKDSFYEELAKSQEAEMDRRQKKSTNVKFVSGTEKATSAAPVAAAAAPAAAADVSSNDDSKKQNRKCSWQKNAFKVSLPTKSKRVMKKASGDLTVISAFGTIVKKAKPSI